MLYIDAQNYKIELGPVVDSSLKTLLEGEFKSSKKVILVDENTHENCLSFLVGNFDELSEAEIVQMPSGEEHKSIDIAMSVWEALTDYGISRKDLIINLGGGIVTDMGGFIASCFKRGVKFINIPTSLLGMVDASIGGKTGLNLGPFKNQIGVFSNPISVIIDIDFLETLPDEEISSGFAEMLKHGIIAGEELWTNVISCMNGDAELTEELLMKCIDVKNKIVQADPLEKGERKLLNVGHTIGHVIEGFFMNRAHITHGHCVAVGIVMEAFLSYKKGVLAKDVYNRIEESIVAYYPIPAFSDEDIREMVAMLYNDKKNEQGKILTCLIEGIGNCTYDKSVNDNEFVEVFLHFKNLNLSLN